jgi:hypothetical protein
MRLKKSVGVAVFACSRKGRAGAMVEPLVCPPHLVPLRIGSTHEAFEVGIVVCCDPGDLMSIERKIGRIVERPKRPEKLGISQRDFVVRQCSRQTALKRYQSAIGKAAMERQTPCV